MKVRKAIIPAAGLGTRFLPATKALPKEMLPIVDKPVIQFIVEEAIASGIEDILIITGRSKRAIEDHFDKSLELETILRERDKTEVLQEIRDISQVNVHYIRQKEPRGLGDAVYQARSFIGNEPFALLLGDDIVEVPGSALPCTRQLIERYEETGLPVIGVQEVEWEKVSQYGIVKTAPETIAVGETATILDMVEKPPVHLSPSRTAIMGRYVLDASIFDYLAKTPKGLGEEIQLTDALKMASQEKEMIAYHFMGTRHDVGTPLGFLEANLMFALRNPKIGAEVRSLMRECLGAPVIQKRRAKI